MARQLRKRVTPCQAPCELLVNIIESVVDKDEIAKEQIFLEDKSEL